MPPVSDLDRYALYLSPVGWRLPSIPRIISTSAPPLVRQWYAFGWRAGPAVWRLISSKPRGSNTGPGRRLTNRASGDDVGCKRQIRQASPRRPSRFPRKRLRRCRERAHPHAIERSCRAGPASARPSWARSPRPRRTGHGSSPGRSERRIPPGIVRTSRGLECSPGYGCLGEYRFLHMISNSPLPACHPGQADRAAPSRDTAHDPRCPKRSSFCQERLRIRPDPAPFPPQPVNSEFAMG